MSSSEGEREQRVWVCMRCLAVKAAVWLYLKQHWRVGGVLLGGEEFKRRGRLALQANEDRCSGIECSDIM